MIQSLLISRKYWVFYAAFSLLLEVFALFYQYYLDYYPCVLCIHVRIILLGILIVSITSLIFYSKLVVRLLAHILLILSLILLTERSYNLLGVERGFIYGDCSMNSGLPSWFSIDQWFPLVFKIWEPCGYTPEIIFGVTMAETLIFLSISLLITAFVALVYQFNALKTGK